MKKKKTKSIWMERYITRPSIERICKKTIGNINQIMLVGA